MDFEKVFEGHSWPEAEERIGVMSVDSLSRQWELVTAENGYLVAKSRNGLTALLGRMCKRDDGKYCIEIAVRATIEHGALRNHEFWYVDPADKLQRTKWLDDAMRRNLGQS